MDGAGDGRIHPTKTGVVGVKQAGNVENAGLCMGMGGLLIAEVVAEVIVTLNFGDFDPASVGSVC